MQSVPPALLSTRTRLVPARGSWGLQLAALEGSVPIKIRFRHLTGKALFLGAMARQAMPRVSKER